MSQLSQVTSVNNTPLPIPVQLRAREVSSKEARLHRLSHYFNAPQIAYRALVKQQASAYELAALDDAAKNASVLGIATIASLSHANKPGQALPIWLGAIGWLTAMRLVPLVMSTLTRAKTGISMDVPYRSSQNDIRNLMENPDYMPTQVIPKDKQIELMRRYNIPLNSTSAEEQLQNKLKQVSIQSHTWWMLLAGPSTPLLASIICDKLEGPVLALRLKQKLGHIQQHFIEPGLAKGQKNLLYKGLQKLAETKLDGRPGVTEVSMWWQNLPEGILRILGLEDPKTLKRLNALSLNEEDRFNRLSKHIIQRLRPLKVREELESYLLRKTNEVNAILDPMIRLLRDPKTIGLIKPADRYELLQQARLTRGRGHATLGHMLGLLDVYERNEKLGYNVLSNKLKQHMEKSTIGYIEQLIQEGRLSRARELTGKYYTQILELTKDVRYIPAQHLMGESPRSLLLRTTQSLAKRQNWLRWFPIALGGVITVATALYVSTILGEDWVTPKSKPRPDEGGPIE